jgi:hypothetical protein
MQQDAASTLEMFKEKQQRPPWVSMSFYKLTAHAI